MRAFFRTVIFLVSFGVIVSGSGFEAPRVWERSGAYSLLQGPIRSAHDGSGGIYLYWGFQDRVGGTLIGEPVRVRESDGMPDPLFQPNNRHSGVIALGLQKDGRVVIAGTRKRGIYVSQLLPDGRPDPTFQEFGTTMNIRHLVPTPDGSVLVTIWGEAVPDPEPGLFSVDRAALVRLLPDGRLDESFRSPIADGADLVPPLVDEVGRIYVAGRFVIGENPPRTNLVRLQPNGTLDPSFRGITGFHGLVGGFIRGLGFQSHGGLVVAGDLRIPARLSVDTPAADRSTNQFVLLRIQSDGQRDPSFTLLRRLDVPLTDYPRHLVVGPDDTLLVAANGPARFNPDGTRDTGFRHTEMPFTSWVSRLGDGRVLVPGADPDRGVSVFLADGTPETQFGLDGFGETVTPTGFAMLGTGAIWVSGNFNRADSAPREGLLALDRQLGNPVAPQPDMGALVGASAVIASSQPSTAAIHQGAGGSAYFGGLGSRRGGDGQSLESFQFLKRLGPDGAQDSAFDPDPRAMHSETDYATDANGELWYFRGRMQSALDWWWMTRSGVAAEPWFWIGRIETSGRLAPEFSSMPDPLWDSILARLTQVESLSPENFDGARMGGIQPVGLLQKGGFVVSVAQTDQTIRLIKVSRDGSIVSAFAPSMIPARAPRFVILEAKHPGTGAMVVAAGEQMGNDIVSAAIERPDGSVIVAGDFLEFGGQARAGLALLGSDGAVLSAPLPRLGRRQALVGEGSVVIYSMAIDAAGRVYLAGDFSMADAVPVPGLIRLRADGGLDTSFQSPIEFASSGVHRAQLRIEGDTLWVGGSFRRLGEAFPRPLWKLDLAMQGIELSVVSFSQSSLRLRGIPLTDGGLFAGTMPRSRVLSSVDLVNWELEAVSVQTTHGVVDAQLPRREGDGQRFYRFDYPSP